MQITVPIFATHSFIQSEDEAELFTGSSSASLPNNSDHNISLKETLVKTKPTIGNRISILRAVVVFLNQNIGIGLLSIPYCFLTGIVLNSIELILFALFAISSFILLVDVSVTTGQSIDYAKFITLSFPGSKHNYEWFPLMIISVTLFGTAILHFQYACTLIQTFFDELVEFGVVKMPIWVYNRWFLIGVPALVIDLPLMFLRSIKALSYASLFTLVLITIYIIHSIYIFVLSMKDSSNKPASLIVLNNGLNSIKKHSFEGLTYFSINKYFIPSLSIQAFAYAFNMMVTPTIEKLKSPHRRNQYKVFAIVISISCFAYIICGALPYLALIPNVTHAIVFEDFVHGRIFTVIMKGLFGMFLIMTTPLILFSCRVAFNDATFRSEFTKLRWNLMGISIMVLAVVVAAVVKSITTVFGFIGGVTSTLAAYVLPAIYYLRICKNESKWKTALSWFLLPLGIVIMCLCLYDSIRSIIKGDGDT